MLVSAGRIGRFIERHPTVKMLALSFLLLIGVALMAEGFGQHISKGYISAPVQEPRCRDNPDLHF